MCLVDGFRDLPQILKRHGIFHIPYRGTMLGAALGGGREILRNPLQPGETMDERLGKKVSRENKRHEKLYGDEIKALETRLVTTRCVGSAMRLWC